MTDHDLATKRPWSVHDAVTVGELCDFEGLAIYQDEDLKISEDGDECPSAICFMNPNWGEAEYTAKFIVAAVEAYDKNKDLSSLLISAHEENSRLRAQLADSEKVISYVENTYADYSVSHKDFRVKAAQMADDYRNGATGDNADE